VQHHRPPPRPYLTDDPFPGHARADARAGAPTCSSGRRPAGRLDHCARCPSLLARSVGPWSPFGKTSAGVSRSSAGSRMDELDPVVTTRHHPRPGRPRAQARAAKLGRSQARAEPGAIDNQATAGYRGPGRSIESGERVEPASCTLESNWRWPLARLACIGWSDLARPGTVAPVSWHDARADTSWAAGRRCGY